MTQQPADKDKKPRKGKVGKYMERRFRERRDLIEGGGIIWRGFLQLEVWVLPREHHLDELVVVDLTITIHISFPDHLLNLVFGKLFAQIRHNMSQLRRANEPIPILIENLESLPDLLLTVRILHLPSHHGQKLGEVDGAVTVGVDFVDHVLEFGFGWVLTQGTHDGAELFGGDGTIAVLVEEGESLLELSDLFFSQLISHGSW